MRVLGVHCSTTYAFFAVSDDGVVVHIGPQRLAPVQSTHEDAALWQTMDAFGAALAEIRPTRIHLLLPESAENARQTHGRWRPRIEMETLLRLAAAQADIPVERLARATARVRLGLPKSGNFDKAVCSTLPETGQYWRTGRGLAVAAALASTEEMRVSAPAG